MKMELRSVTLEDLRITLQSTKDVVLYGTYNQCSDVMPMVEKLCIGCKVRWTGVGDYDNRIEIRRN